MVIISVRGSLYHASWFLKCFILRSIYLDTGGSKLIGEGKIKLKNDTLLEGFIETGLKFEDGSELQADVVVFATG